MRLNESTYPAYFRLLAGDKFGLHVDEAFSKDGTIDETTFIESVNSVFEVFSQVKHRYYITNPFAEAMEKAMPKIAHDHLHLTYEKSDCGIYFTDKGFSLYLINPKDNKVKMIAFSFSRKAMTGFVIVTTDNKCTGRYYRRLEDGSVSHSQQYLTFWANSLFMAHYFINNCEIETKLVEPKQKLRTAKDKHYNESPRPFTVLDCAWFTQLVSSGAFTVSGHMRWQRCGVNFEKKKLIFINSFSKNGYTRKARKPIQ